MSDKKRYSANGEDFNYTELDDAVYDAFDDSTIEVGAITVIDVGYLVERKAGDFAYFDPLDTLANAAYGEHDEYVGDWPNCTKEQEAELLACLKDAVNMWADKHSMHPKFYGVSNVQKITVKLMSEEGEYEIIKEG